MPLYDVECPKGHKNEVLLSHAEAEQLGTDLKQPCPTEGCDQLARRDGIGLTGSMAVQWRRAAHGSSL